MANVAERSFYAEKMKGIDSALVEERQRAESSKLHQQGRDH